MMAHSVTAYVQKSGKIMTERWLREQRNGPAVNLICTADTAAWARARAAEHPIVKQVIEIPSFAPEEAAAVKESEASLVSLLAEGVVFPVAPNTVKLRFLPGNHTPWIQPYFADFRRLWLLGARRVTLYTLGGTTELELPYLLDAFHRVHAGKRCFVVGNGPSLNDIDMTRLRNELVFGSNRCYIGYEKWGFSFPFWGAIDRLQLEEYGPEYEDYVPEECIKFFPFEYLPYLRMKNACPMNFTYDSRLPYRFSNSPDIIYLGFTITHALLQVAAMMGCNPIILIGVDHRYNLAPKDTPETLRTEAKSLVSRVKERVKHTAAYDLLQAYRQVRAERRQDVSKGSSAAKTQQQPPLSKLWAAADASRPTHFSDAYTGGPKRFVMPQPEKSEAAFDAAAAWAKENGIEILNATPGTALKSFPLVDYDSLF